MTDQTAETRADPLEELREALVTALSVALHEHFDPACDGVPPYTLTRDQAVALTADVMRAPILRTALAALTPGAPDHE